MSLHARYRPRIPKTQLHCTQWRRIPARFYSSSTGNPGDPPWFQALRSEMLGRPSAASRELVNIENHFKLIDTLSPFLPSRWRQRSSRRTPATVPLGQSLLWFNTSMPVDQLLPDGTDPLQSPGEPWVRRMWAGGHMKLNATEYYRLDKGFAMDSSIACAERIQDVQLRGAGDAAKIFVTLERRFTRLETLREKIRSLPQRVERVSPLEVFREQLLSNDWGDAVLKEVRNLVFLKHKTRAELETIQSGHFVPVKYLQSPGKPDFSHALIPTRPMLFRYSALTLNAHLIHLDRDYARNVEGHRNLLVHGPLSLTLMLQAIAGHVKKQTEDQCVLESITYRNIAPLYCDEKMVLCGRKKRSSDQGDLYDVWIEGPSGGVAVKGTVRTVLKSITNVPKSRKVTGAVFESPRHTKRKPSKHVREEKVVKLVERSVQQIFRRVAFSAPSPRYNNRRKTPKTEDIPPVVAPQVRLSSFTMPSVPLHSEDARPNSVPEIGPTSAQTLRRKYRRNRPARASRYKKGGIRLIAKLHIRNMRGTPSRRRRARN